MEHKHEQHEHHHEHGENGGNDHDEHAHHSPDIFRRKFWITFALSIPVIFTSPMVMEWFGYSLNFPGITVVGPLLGTVIFFYGGAPFLKGALPEIRSRQPGMMLLIALAISVAYLASFATTLHLLALDFWWELAALITVMLLGHWQEMKAIGSAQSALKSLEKLIPQYAERIAPDGTIESVNVSALRSGDAVLIRAGSRVPADGSIVSGTASVDESMLTGESQPVTRGPDAQLAAGTVVTDSPVRMRVAAVGENTTVAGIQRMVSEAQKSHSRAQTLANRFAGWLFYLAVAVAVVTFTVWWSVGSLPQAVTHTVTVLVIACPHALGLAIPLVTAISTAVAARAGILIKDRIALERMRSVDTVLFDKTGTLTQGEYSVNTVLTASSGHSEEELLALTAAVESESEHPLGEAIVRAAKEQDVTTPAAVDARTLPGRGVLASVDGHTYAVGGPQLLREMNATLPENLTQRTAPAVERGEAVLYALEVSDTLSVLGAVTLSDTVRPDAARTITDLRDEGVHNIAMVTGDSRAVANTVAQELEFRDTDTVFAEVLPAEKDAKVAQLQQKHQKVAMVGDGINDAPALARADVGIAIGAGTQIAMESAGIVLASSDLRGVPRVRKLSAATYRKMVQNLAWASGYNILALPLAAGALSWAGLTISPAVGAILMSLSTIIVALNAQLLRWIKL